MNSLPEALVKIYKREYETTDITKSALQAKYQLPTIPEDWMKPSKPTETNKQEAIVPPSTNTEKIEEFKKLALNHALKFMQDDAQFAEVKEFKDMVSIVGTIEASYKDTKPENTINIAIQNIVKGFTDDC